MSTQIIGNLISVRKDLVLRMKTDGHFIGSHSYTHPHLNSMTPTSIEKELDDTQQAWQSITNNAYGNLTYFRSPYGELNSLVRQTVQNKGYKIILWNADLKDWSSDRKLIRSNVHGFIKTLDPSVTGLILLSHWLNDEMVCGVQAVIKAFKARGYLFVSAEECFFGLFFFLFVIFFASFCFSSGITGTNRVAPALVNWNISVNIEDSPCHHPPYSAVDEGCHAHAVCAENTCCHPDGWCSNNTEACGTSCLNGACYACGNPLLLFPAITNLDADADDDYGCPPKPKIPTTFWTGMFIYACVCFQKCVFNFFFVLINNKKNSDGHCSFYSDNFWDMCCFIGLVSQTKSKGKRKREITRT